MKLINKQESPEAFENWKTQENPKSWSDLHSRKIKEDEIEEGICYYSKEELRTVLIDEQGFICAYCQDVVQNNHTSKIEHLKAKGRPEYKDLTFDYNNLLICCKGEKFSPPPKESHCDTFRDNTDIPITPLMDNCHEHFRYTANGEINSNSDDGSETINLLNLKTPKLNNKRREVIEGWLDPEVDLTVADINMIKEYMNIRNEDNSFHPFCQVIQSILS